MGVVPLLIFFHEASINTFLDLTLNFFNLFLRSGIVRFGIGFKKNTQFFPIVLQKITDCSDYCPFK